MAINKKLVHFKTFANFKSELDAGNILDTSICWIKDTQQIYTHGQYYNCNTSYSKAPESLINFLDTYKDDIYNESSLFDAIHNFIPNIPEGVNKYAPVSVNFNGMKDLGYDVELNYSIHDADIISDGYVFILNVISPNGQEGIMMVKLYRLNTLIGSAKILVDFNINKISIDEFNDIKLDITSNKKTTNITLKKSGLGNKFLSDSGEYTTITDTTIPNSLLVLFAKSSIGYKPTSEEITEAFNTIKEDGTASYLVLNCTQANNASFKVSVTKNGDNISGTLIGSGKQTSIYFNYTLTSTNFKVSNYSVTSVEYNYDVLDNYWMSISCLGNISDDPTPKKIDFSMSGDGTKFLSDNGTYKEVPMNLPEGYAASESVNLELEPKAGDSFETAISKLHKAILDNEEVTAQAFVNFQTVLGTENPNMTMPDLSDTNYLNGQTQFVAALKALDTALKTVADQAATITALESRVEALEEALTLKTV